jgi:uncharacterized protein DUF4157/L,D-transpeptidase-like protein
MRESLPEREKPAAAKPISARTGLLQRKCACGGPAGVDGGCEECRTKRLVGSQRSADLAAKSSAGEQSDSQSQAEQVPILRRAEGGGFTRLGLSKPGDPCEIEADAVAEKVVSNAPQPHPARISAPAPVPGIHRQQDEDGSGTQQDGNAVENSAADNSTAVDGESTGDDTEDDDITCDETGCPKMESSASPASGRAVSVNIPKNGGRPLDAPVRTFMESRFGHDFSRVSVHTDSDAAQSARRLKAHAYTIGPDIYFAGGGYNPKSTEGLRLLAHELTHVVQQSEQNSMTETIHRKEAACSGDCASAKAPKHDGCNSGSAAANASKFISNLLVERKAHKITATWSDSSTSTYACSPSTKSGKGGKMPTPLGDFKVGVKCDSCHTNRKGDGMAWFTGIVERQIGFHDSQLVGPSHESHGCIRVSCGDAKEIHDNTASKTTDVHVDP